MMEYVTQVWSFLSSVPGPAYLVAGIVGLKTWTWLRSGNRTPQVDHRANLYTTIDGLLNDASNWEKDAGGINHMIASVTIALPTESGKFATIITSNKDVSDILYEHHRRRIDKKARRLGFQIVENKAQAEAAKVALTLTTQPPKSYTFSSPTTTTPPATPKA